MKNQTLVENMTETEQKAYYSRLVKQTRQYGSCYVHSGMRVNLKIDGISFCVTGYGRSLQGGGHKYKVYAYSIETGRPVPTKDL